MEGNSDKQMRDKLNGVEFPFDPKAWESMEAMLDKKKKRRGFIWWWWGGAAALLVSGFVSYGVLHSLTGNKTAANTKQQTVAENTQGVAGDPKQANSSLPKTGNLQTQNNSSPSTQQPTSENYANNGSTSQSNTGNSETGATQLSHQQQTTANITASVPGIKGNITSHKQTAVCLNIHKHNATGNSRQSGNNIMPVKQSRAKNSTPINELATQPVANNAEQRDYYITADKKYLDKLPASLQNETMTLIGDDGKKYKTKVKPPVFKYALGAITGITASASGEVIASQGNASKPVFSKAPSYMVGISNDFLFVNRVAITTSVVFSQTAFKINNPQVDGNGSAAPISYTCSINELDIPIGIKVYPVFKPAIRFYINTGIINHIRLKETFNYTFGTVDTPLNATAYVPADLYPTRTNFGGGGTTANYSSLSGTPFTNSSQFSINGNKRYYASYYFNAGVEGVIKNHFILFAEPTFFFGLSSIGIQERRKYNVGANLGFRYSF